MRNWSYKIIEGEHAGETLWSGRYCCVAGFIFNYTNDDIKILAVKRGQDCPDFKGMWCCPCGFLEADETGEEGVVRETWEETGYDFPVEKFKLFIVETDPKLCNKSHVTLMYSTIFDQDEIKEYFDIDWLPFDRESEKIEWISINEINKYEWAFGHDRIIKEMLKQLDYDEEELNYDLFYQWSQRPYTRRI